MYFAWFLIAWTLLPLFFFTAFYLYSSRHKNYWKDQGLPHEPYSIISAVTGPFKKEQSPPMKDLRLSRQLGKVYGTFEGDLPALFVTDPELIKEIFVKEFSSISSTSISEYYHPLLDYMMSLCPAEMWRRIRPLLLPAFATGNLRKLNADIQDCARQTAARLVYFAENCQHVDAVSFFGQYSAQVVARCGLGVEINSSHSLIEGLVPIAFSDKCPPLRQAVLNLFPNVAKLLRIGPIVHHLARDGEKVAKDLIQLRRKSGCEGTELLQPALERLNLSKDSVHHTSDRQSKDHRKKRCEQDFTEDEMMAQCVVYLLAGTETPASPLAVAASYLAQNPDIQLKLRDEVDQCFAENVDHEPTFDDVSKLKYLQAVISEAMRIKPPIPRLDRCVVRDVTVGKSRIRLRKGTPVFVPVYALHHDPDFFPEPGTFKPERFLDDYTESERRYTFLPFGAGPRACIAMRFAMHAMKVCLLHAIRHVEFLDIERTAQLSCGSPSGDQKALPGTLFVRVKTRGHRAPFERDVDGLGNQMTK